MIDDPDGLTAIHLATDLKWLLAEYRQEREITLRSVRRMAAIVFRIKELGHELPPGSDIPYLLRVADGKLDAELFHVARDNRALLQRAQMLLSEDQERVAANLPFMVVTGGGDHRMVPALELTPRECEQVFGRGRVRSETEQRAWLQERLDREEAHKARGTEPLVRVDRKRNGLVVTAPGFLPASEVIHLLGELNKSRR